MAVAKGRAFLIYVGAAVATAADADETNFVLIAGAQERSLAINTEAIDGTHAPAALADPLWAINLSGAKSMAIECAARFVNDAGERRAMDIALSETTHVIIRLIYPEDDTPAAVPVAAPTDIYGTKISGEFLLTALSHTGGLADTFNWSMSLVLNGIPTVVLPA